MATFPSLRNPHFIRRDCLLMLRTKSQGHLTPLPDILRPMHQSSVLLPEETYSQSLLSALSTALTVDAVFLTSATPDLLQIPAQPPPDKDILSSGELDYILL